SAASEPAHAARTHKAAKPAAGAQKPADKPADAKPDSAASTAEPASNAKPGALNVPTPGPPSINAKSWLLMDFATGQVLADSASNERVEPASITKVMTSYVVSAELAARKVNLDDPVFISETAWRGGGAGTEGSTSFLAVNSKVPLRDLLYGMIIQSGND